MSWDASIVIDPLGLTLAQAARRLGRSRAYCERLGRIRAIETRVGPGARVFYDPADVERIAAGQSTQKAATS